MRAARFAPLTLIATLGLAFTSSCGDEKTVGDAAAATATRLEPPAPTGWIRTGHLEVTLYRPRTDQVVV
jgi:hypothetical protein